MQLNRSKRKYYFEGRYSVLFISKKRLILLEKRVADIEKSRQEEKEVNHVALMKAALKEALQALVHQSQ